MLVPDAKNLVTNEIVCVERRNFAALLAAYSGGFATFAVIDSLNVFARCEGVATARLTIQEPVRRRLLEIVAAFASVNIDVCRGHYKILFEKRLLTPRIFHNKT